MKIAFLILAHDNPQHLRRLIAALQGADSSFFVHIDGKRRLSDVRVPSLPNVHCVSPRSCVYWGRFSMVQATLRLIDAALGAAPSPDYLVLLSGVDYPICPTTHIFRFFEKHNGNQFINMVRMPNTAADKTLLRLELHCVQVPPTPPGLTLLNRALFKVASIATDLLAKQVGYRRDFRKAIAPCEPYGGGQWWAITADAARHIQRFVRDRPEFVRFFRHTLIPDETFFHTILGNSEFASRLRHSVAFADWSRPYGRHPAYIDEEHLSLFERQRPFRVADAFGEGDILIARKFCDASGPLVDRIDRVLRLESPCRAD